MGWHISMDPFLLYSWANSSSVNGDSQPTNESPLQPNNGEPRFEAVNKPNTGRRVSNQKKERKRITTSSYEPIKKRKIDKHTTFQYYAMQNYPDNYLFKWKQRDSNCDICKQPINVHICLGKCGNYFHKKCLHQVLNQYTSKVSTTKSETGSGSRFECIKCSSERESQCFVCGRGAEQLTKCVKKDCGYYYHIGCLKYWPQHKITHIDDVKTSMICPRHICHICVADDPHSNCSVENDQKLTKCSSCPATYHRKSIRIPAGSEITSNSQILCPRHCIDAKKPNNINWCFFCGHGGQVINCKTCPIATHRHCLERQPLCDDYTCIVCETGRLPLYGEIVWVKCMNFDWWPGMLVAPNNLPESVAVKKPGANYMCIYFFGSYNFGWVCRSNIYLYEEEDTDVSHLSRNYKKYNTAIEEASKCLKETK